jgi:hypothetical protein
MSALAGGSSQVANYMYDQGGNNYNQETVQIASVQSRLSDMTLGYLKGIASMIESVQGDPDKFLKLCSAGGFTQVYIDHPYRCIFSCANWIQRMTGSLPDQTSNILDQLKLYILSLSLQLNNFVVSVRYACLLVLFTSPRV